MENSNIWLEVLIEFKWPLIILFFSIFFSILFRDRVKNILSTINNKLRSLNYKKRGSDIHLGSNKKSMSKNINAEDKGEEESEEKDEREDKEEKEEKNGDSPQDIDTAEYEVKSLEEYNKDLTDLIFDDRIEEADKLFNSIKEKESDEVKKLELEGRYRYALYLYGDRTSLDKLKKLTSKEAFKAKGNYYIAKCYKYSNQYNQARKYFNKSIEKTKKSDEETRVKSNIGLSRSLVEIGEVEEGIDNLCNLIDKINSNNNCKKVFIALSNIYNDMEQYDKESLALELALECEPNNSNLIFKTAYAYLNSGDDNLSIFHNENLLDINPNDKSSLNNLGVSYNRIGLVGKASKFYKLAWQNKSTIAAANLANKYIKEGFFEEAEDLIDNALNMENPNSKVKEALSEISVSKNNENTQRASILDNAKKVQTFKKLFAKKFFSNTSNYENIDGEWISDDGSTIMNIKVENNQIEGYWGKDNKYRLNGNLVHNVSFVRIDEKEKIIDDHIYMKYCYGKLLVKSNTIIHLFYKHKENEVYKIRKFIKNK